MKEIAKSKAKEEKKKLEAEVTFFFNKWPVNHCQFIVAVYSEELGQTFHAI